MVQSAFVDFYKAENLQGKSADKAQKHEIVVTELVTGTGRRPILPPSIMATMPEFTTVCGKTLASILLDSNLSKAESRLLTQVLKNKEKKWIGQQRALQIPKDENQPIRDHLLETYTEQMRRIPSLSSENSAEQSSAQLLSILDERVKLAKALKAHIEEGMNSMEERIESRAGLQEPNTYLSQIHYVLDCMAILDGAVAPLEFGKVNISLKEAQQVLAEVGGLYTLATGKIGHRVFIEQCEELLNEIKCDIIRPSAQNRQSITEHSRAENFLARYINLMGDDSCPTPVSRSIAVTSDMLTLLFPARNKVNTSRAWPLEGPIFPRMEQIYKLAISTNRAQSISSSINVLGEKSACSLFGKFVALNPVVRQVKLDASTVSSVIGPGGAHKRQIEEHIKAPIAIHEGTAYILGTPDQVTQFHTSVSALLKELTEQRRNNAANTRLPITRVQAKYLSARQSGGMVMKNVARAHEVAARVLNGRTDDIEDSFVLLQGLNGSVIEAQKQLEPIIDGLDYFSMQGPARASRKLLSGLNALRTLDRVNKQLESTKDLTEINPMQKGAIDIFGEIVRSCKLSAFLLDEEQMASEASHFAKVMSGVHAVSIDNELDEDTNSLMIVVGSKTDIETQKAGIVSCFIEASFINEIMEISTSQAQVLTRDTLISIGDKMSVQIRFAGRDKPGTANAKQRIALAGAAVNRSEARDMIHQWISDNAVETIIVLKCLETRHTLMTNGRALLNYFQDVHDVHIMFTAPANATGDDQNPLELRIVGSKSKTSACVEEIREKDEVYFLQEKNNETRQVEIPRASVGKVVGAKGITMRNIEAVSGARIIQRRDGAESEMVVFDIKGPANSIEVAIGMIEGNIATGDQARNTTTNKEENISVYEKLPFQPAYMSNSRSRGRGHVAAPKNITAPIGSAAFDDEFPDLGFDLGSPSKKLIFKPSQKASKKATSAVVEATVVEEAVVEEAVVEEAVVEEAVVEEAVVESTVVESTVVEEAVVEENEHAAEDSEATVELDELPVEEALEERCVVSVQDVHQEQEAILITESESDGTSNKADE